MGPVTDCVLSSVYRQLTMHKRYRLDYLRLSCVIIYFKSFATLLHEVSMKKPRIELFLILDLLDPVT